MAGQANRRTEPGRTSTGTMALLVLLLFLFAVVGVLWAAVALGSQLSGVNPDLPADPFDLMDGLRRGTVVWPAAATWLAIVFGAVVLALSGLFAWAVGRSSSRRSRVDGAARYLAGSRELADITRKGAEASAKRLGVATPGVPIGVTVKSRQMIYSLWEWMMIGVAGPRVGKSTALVIPAIMAAPGAVVTTSNKRDVLDATRDPRAAVGEVWVFDPQGVALEEPTWWWNPLSYVIDDTRAAKLAQHFASGTRAAGSTTDNYFDAEGQNLLADMLLAAALGGHPISQVYIWLTDPLDLEPPTTLKQHGFELLAQRLRGYATLTEKQRDGVYGTARQMAACLTNSGISQWVNPLGGNLLGDRRPQFDPDAFVRAGTGTLYSLSKEGQGSAGPLVTALTAATIEAAEELATRQRGGRLAVPLLGILDEAANVCRWKNLPDLYSHFGSRGIPIMSLFQSWSQGIEVFGREGMRKLWSASNTKVYLGGVSEAEFLRELSTLIGDYDMETASVSYNKGVRSTTHQLRRDRILDESQLAALPTGRGVVFTSGAPATLIETRPYWTGPHKEAIAASIANHDPSLPPAPATSRPRITEQAEVEA
ncbi:type IV secretory system conjugative DNA transfer family protein [Agromyces sp. GXQ0307]|uniref:type IV secretory system conjugative DNA transfer family protein n=1 Tax=Agromyces sp. GXQ0307 TaxID=3377835 RepID=UPI00383B2D35